MILTESALELNAEFKRALDLMEQGKNVFITGKAGSGKSTLLDLFRKQTRKRIAVLAPTGVAALNVQGQTIHSFFKFYPDITVAKARKKAPKKELAEVLKKLDALVIDEISMVRADLLDCVNEFLKHHGPKKKQPFGGLQVVFIGDLYQLPPVITWEEREYFNGVYESEYFFDSNAFKEIPVEFVELETVYRQKDRDFIELLNAVRTNSINDNQLNLLNRGAGLDFGDGQTEYRVFLTTTKNLAKEVNDLELEKLSSLQRCFTGKVKGEFQSKELPTEKELVLKVGAQIMMLTNEPSGNWVNGSIGKVTAINKVLGGGDEVLEVKLSTGRVVDVKKFTWNSFNYAFNEEKDDLETQVAGSFTQYPLKLAWAVTIHKSQGKTFDDVVIDFGNGTFAPGQAYVALSRCTSLKGIVLKRPLEKRHVFADWRVVRFMESLNGKTSPKRVSLDEKLSIVESAISKKNLLELVYLNASGEKSTRVIRPEFLGNMEFEGAVYFGVRGFCLKRNEDRTFKLNRMLEVKEVPRQ